MAILQVGYATRSAYEYSHHIRISREFGVSDADIRAARRRDRRAGYSILDPLAKVVLRAAREMTSRSRIFPTKPSSDLRHGLNDESI